MRLQAIRWSPNSRLRTSYLTPSSYRFSAREEQCFIFWYFLPFPVWTIKPNLVSIFVHSYVPRIVSLLVPSVNWPSPMYNKIKNAKGDRSKTWHFVCFLMMMSSALNAFTSSSFEFYFLNSSSKYCATSCISITNKVGARLSSYLTPRPCRSNMLFLPAFIST